MQKRLGDVFAAGDLVSGVIVGSAVSNDGADSRSLLTPSVEDTAEMLLRTTRTPGWRTWDVDFVEAHGTGKPMIDSIEFTALGDDRSAAPRSTSVR